MKRVVVTGMGVVTPLGNDVVSFFDALAAGRSGVKRLEGAGTERLANRVAAPASFDPQPLFDPPKLRMLDRVSQFALAAASQAVADARAPFESGDAARRGVFVGTGMAGAGSADEGYHTLYAQGSDRIKPFTVLMAMNNAPASWIGLEYGATGPTLTYSTACSSSAVAIGEAARRIAAGETDVAIAGGAEACLNLGTLKAWEALRTLAVEDPHDPSASCKPFAKDRTGLVLGEGAAMLVLEDRERALARGATIHARRPRSRRCWAGPRTRGPSAPRNPCTGTCWAPPARSSWSSRSSRCSAASFRPRETCKCLIRNATSTTFPDRAEAFQASTPFSPALSHSAGRTPFSSRDAFPEPCAGRCVIAAMEQGAATKDLTKSYKRTGIARRIFVILGLAIIFYGVVVGLIAPPIAKKVIADKLGEKLGRVVQIDHVSVNPYTLAARVEGMRVLEPDRKTVFAGFRQLDLDASASSITRFAPIVDEVTLDGLEVRLARDRENHYNASDILARLAQAPKAKPEEPARFSVSNIRVVNARVAFDDRPLGTRHEVTDIDIAIPFVSNLPRHLEEFVQPRLTAKVNGAPLAIRGETMPFENSLRTHVALQLEGFDLPRYVGYSPSPLPVKLEAGKLDGRVEIRFTQAQAKEATVELSGNLVLRDVAVSASDRELAKLSAVRADGLHVDLLAKAVTIESLAMNGGAIALQRRADGSLDLPQMPDSPPAPAEAQPSRPWHVKVAKATVDDFSVTVEDASVKPAMTHRVSIAHAEALGWASDKDAKMTVAASLGLDNGGTVEVDSTVALDPLTVDAKIDARHIDLVPLRPYVQQFQTVKVKSALASAKGRVQLRSSGPSLRVAYAGSAELSKVASLDTVSKEDLLNWDSVRADGIAFAWGHDQSVKVAVGDIAVKKLYARVFVTPEGKINLQQLKLATPENPAPAPQSPDELKPRDVRIDRVVFVDSRLNFTDHYIKPNYTADVGDLNGTVTGLSSEPSARGVVDLKGSYDKSSPVIIAGTINPLSGELFLDIAAKGKDIDLPRLSAYSMRYAGYPIKDGKLTLDVKYHVEDGKLDGRNNIVLDQLTFGDKVESPEATTLPVLFAVNLLKDANGRINLELPIKGSLEDPQFDIGALIGQVVSNLLKKALTAPFQLLAAALGGSGGSTGGGAATGGDDLAYVAFDPGGAEASAGERAKLERITKALLDRPGVKLEMASHVDPEKDRAALKRAALRAKLREAKGGAFEESEYPGLVKAAYEKEFGAKKGEDAKKDAKEPALEEMEARLSERLTVDDEALRALAARRALWVKSYLTAEGRLPADRVVVASADAGDIATRESRVDFTLK